MDEVIPGHSEAPADPEQGRPTPAHSDTAASADHVRAAPTSPDDIGGAAPSPDEGHTQPPGALVGGAAGTATTPTHAHGRRRKRWLPREVRWSISVVVLLLVLELFVVPELATARKSIHTLAAVNVPLLCVGVALEAVSLLAYAELTHTVLSPGAPHRFTLFRINMSSLAVSHVLPGGTAPGTAVAYRLLIDSDVPGSTAAFALATQGVGSAVILNAILWLALLISIPLTGYNPLYGFAAIFGVILLSLFAGTILLLTRGKHQAADFLHRLAVHVPFVNPASVSALVQKLADRIEILLDNSDLLTKGLVWAAANWLLDAASLWIFLLAFGRVLSPIDLLVAYGLANVLAVIPITPGGLGVVEAVLISTFVGFHVPKTIAVLGVIGYRLVNFWLPIPLGGVAYLSLRFGPRARRRRRIAQQGAGDLGIA